MAGCGGINRLRQTANGKRQTANGKRQTANGNKLQAAQVRVLVLTIANLSRFTFAVSRLITAYF